MFDFFNLLQPYIFLKIAVLIIIGMYAIFTVVIVVQVRVMNKVITVPPASSFMFLLAFSNMLLAISLFLLALGIL